MARDHESRVLIAGGGVAGLEAALALADLASGRASIELLTPEPDFLYKPLLVEEPFTGEPPRQLAIAPLLAAVGAELIRGSLESVDPEARLVAAGEAGELAYDYLVVCVGGRARPAYEGVHTFWAGSSEMPVDGLIESAATGGNGALDLVVPPGTTWPLPLYELALSFRQRAEQRGRGEMAITLHTPEKAPLAVFGVPASDALSELFAARRIGIAARASFEPGVMPLSGPVVALPLIDGPRLQGLPQDDGGFIPIDRHSRVRGADRVYAAGDGADFPIKQGGLATQQADAAAEHIASRLGSDLAPQPFTPILRGILFTAGRSLNLRGNAGGDEEEASLDRLWWPPEKIAGKYLSSALASGSAFRDLEVAGPESIPIEVALPRQWHEQPLLPGA